MDPLGNPILERNLHGWLIDKNGKRVNSRGYFCDSEGNVLDMRGHVMFPVEVLDRDGEIPEVFRSAAGLLKPADSESSMSRLMSEIERNQPEEIYNNSQLVVPGSKPRKRVIIS
jgi:hypothetical protein